MPPFDPLGIGLMQRAQDRRSQWDFAKNRTLMPGEIEDQTPNPMGTAPHMASFDMLPQYLNEVGEDTNAQGLKYKTAMFRGTKDPLRLSGIAADPTSTFNTASMTGLRALTEKKP